MPQFHFKGKVFVENHHLAVPFHELLPVREKGLSEKASLHDNLVIHGDNLAALKSLLPTYHGKVKCIYIDPPYNTGNEGWAYNDNVNSPLMQNWLGKVVDREDLTRHDKWCCMMMPRLKLLRELLAEDGAIFVSIDDNEVHHLRCLMDEVFGEENFFAILSRRAMHTVRNSSKDFNLNADYVLAYARRKEWFGADKSRYIRQMVDKSDSYPHDDGDGRGKYKLDPIHARNYYARYTFTFQNGTVWEAPSGSYPRYSPETLQRMERKGSIDFRGKEPMAKRYLNEVQEGRPPDTFLKPEDVGFNKDGTSELAEIFGAGGVFSQPKPTKLIQFLIALLRDPDAIILDSFAGSGTTAHAVLAQNREDGGNRRFILVECEDYADTITAERVRRVINGYAFTGTQKTELMREKITWAKLSDKLTGSVKAIEEQYRDDYDQISRQFEQGKLVVAGETAVVEHTEGLGGTFSYFELGHPMRQESLLDGSHLPSWEKLASYIFFTATGQEFDPAETNSDTGFVGRTASHDVFLLYEPNVEKLKNLALTLPVARALPSSKRKRLVFAPAKYLDSEFLHEYRIDFQQLPFQIYEAIERLEP